VTVHSAREGPDNLTILAHGGRPGELTAALAAKLGIPATGSNGKGHHDQAPDVRPGEAWSRRADELAAWTEKRMVNRLDIFGGYYIGGDGKVALTTSKDELTRERIVRHYQATSIGDVLGLHTTALIALDKELRTCQSLWGAADIDHHGDGPAPEANRAAAQAWRDVLAGLGFHPLLTDSNGKGGFHLRVFFEEPTCTAHVRQLFRWLTRDWKERGLESAPEVFPKQPEITASGQGSCGNWLRLPGRHHKRDHWATVWDGDAWLQGDDAIDYILDLTGDSAQLIPNEALSYEPEGGRKTSSRSGEQKSADDIGYAKQALEHLGKDAFDHYSSWLLIGMALYEFGDAGLELWEEWSKQSSGKHEATGKNSCAAKWETFKAAGTNGVTLGTLFHHAKAAGWPGFPAGPTMVWGKSSAASGDGQVSGPERFKRFPFSNCLTVKDDQGQPSKEPRSVNDMAGYLKRKTGGWPKRVGEQLFVEGDEQRPIFLGSSTQLFGVLDSVSAVFWVKGAAMLTQERFFEFLRKLGAEQFETIEPCPHHPPMAGAFYMHRPLEATGGGLFDQLLQMLTPATEQDRELIRAALMTPFWGGPAGKRPAFRIEGPQDDPESGRGTGKTTLAATIASIAGGSIRLEEGEEFGRFITRLLSNEHGMKRVVLIDNVKKARFSWSCLEEFITSPVISGHALFRGEAQRPNNLVTIITMNGGSFSKDMAQRIIPIRLARPEHSPEWDKKLAAFIEANRWGLIAEIIDTLGQDPGMLKTATRWALWEEQVLGQCGQFKECQALIKERIGAIDDDDDDAFEFEAFVAEKLVERKHNPLAEVVRIPTSVIARWLTLHEHGSRGKPIKPNTATTLLKAKPLKRLAYRRKESERLWVWRGKNTSKETKESGLFPESDWTQTAD
jgi:Primase C terminal 2 (PriCT-2)